ncbi:MAG TPA: protein-disulfide reductase DsbD domain-containing protein [Sphingomicrobium sp.]|nr:protein-disulfide reductase DsbD domain-containing protein [Sphingomicrobium sp.]
MFRLIVILLALITAPASVDAQRRNAIEPILVAETASPPGRDIELAILMRTSPGWHGYWLNPGDAGLPMQVDWQLPEGAGLGPLRYPVPSRLTIAGIMNYVYERDYAVLTRLKVPAGATGTIAIRAKARWLACTDKICVPEKGEFALDLPVARKAARDTRFDEWRRALPRPLATPARFEVRDSAIHVAIPLPASVEVGDPYVFPATDGPIDYAAPQRFRRNGDALIAELPRRTGTPQALDGVLALGDGTGFAFRAVPGDVPDGGSPLGEPGARAMLLAVLGALAGGILLNLMPCVFPILGLKAMHLAKSGGDERGVRGDALAYAAGAIIGTGALGLLLLAIRAGGSAAGWAFQLQDPRAVLLLTLLATAITLNLLRVFELPVMAGEHNPAGSFGTGALAAFVATPCAGPFLGAALGTALLLPAAGSVLVFAALGLGLALPFLAIAFIPALRKRLPRPGPWMARLQRFLAIPMAATVAACLWLLWRQAGPDALLVGAGGVGAAVILLVGFGYAQRSGRSSGPVVLVALGLASIALFRALPQGTTAGRPATNAAAWNEARVQAQLAAGHPVFVYFTADWCLSCKANEAVAIDRDEVRQAFKAAGVKVLVGDWTNGDPAITRFLDGRGHAGVPLYLWYEPGREAEELPQILAPSMLISRARRVRPARR